MTPEPSEAAALVRWIESRRDVVEAALERYVPARVTEQVKQGFAGPDAAWFRGESLDYVRRLIHDPNALMYEFLDPKTVGRLVDEHLTGKANRRLLLWSLLSFEHWCRTFIDGETQS